MAKKQKNCDANNPDDDDRGDCRDFVAYDPEHRLVLAVVPGARTVENAEAIVAEAKRRLGGKAPDLMTSDESSAYPGAIEAAFSEPAPAPRKRKPGPTSNPAEASRGGRPELRDGPQASREQPSRRGGAAASLRVSEGLARGVGAIAGE